MVMAANQNKILLIELAGIGDVVLSSPAIRNLRTCYADSSIYFLTYPGPAQIVKNSPYLDEVFIIKKGAGRFFSNFRVLNKLRSLTIDIAVNLYLHHTLRGVVNMATLMKIIRPRKTFGRNTDGKGFFYDIKIDDSMNSTRHDAEYKLDLIKALGCNIKDKQLEIWPEDSAKIEVEGLLEKNSVSASDFLIGINPGATRLSHRWDWENFAKVGEVLAGKYKAKIVITGSRNEKELAEKILHKISDSVIDTTGNSLAQLTAVIKRCSLYITNDTGPMHIANALRIPLVAIMGPGIMKTSPYQKENCIILRKDVECWPCYKFRCKDMKCLNLVTVNEVIEASKKLLER